MSAPGSEANISYWVREHAEKRGARTAVVDPTHRLDYANLEGRVRRCAGFLADRGIGRGDRVALVLPNSSAYLELVLGAARLGAMAVPLNARLTPRELGGLLRDAEPQQAQAALHVHVDGMSHAEAAKVLGVSRRTVGNLLERFTAWARTQADEEQP